MATDNETGYAVDMDPEVLPSRIPSRRWPAGDILAVFVRADDAPVQAIVAGKDGVRLVELGLIEGREATLKLLGFVKYRQYRPPDDELN